MPSHSDAGTEPRIPETQEEWMDLVHAAGLSSPNNHRIADIACVGSSTVVQVISCQTKAGIARVRIAQALRDVIEAKERARNPRT